MNKDKPVTEKMRLDKWLKIARLFKTRSRSVEACSGRHVKVNGKTAKPSQMIKVGDTISIQFPSRNRTFDVEKLAERSIPAVEARELYIEHLPKITEDSAEKLALFMKLDTKRRRERKGKGRPTKLERRQLEKMKGK